MVRFSSGTYHARAEGKSASSTQSAEFAVRALADKLRFEEGFRCVEVTRWDASRSTWQLVGWRRDLPETELMEWPACPHCREELAGLEGLEGASFSPIRVTCQACGQLFSLQLYTDSAKFGVAA